MARWLLVVANLSLASAVFAAEKEAPKPLASFHVAAGGDLLLVPVTVWGREQLFILDTGSSGTCFDEPARRRLGAEVGKARFKAAYGSLRASLYLAPAMRLGNLPIMPTRPVTCFDLAPVREATGTNESGIIGTDTFRSFVVQIDFDHGVVSFYSASVQDRNWGEPVPMRSNEHGDPQVDITVCGITRPFLVDTGAADTMSIDHKLCDDLNRLGKLHRTRQGRSMGLAGIEEVTEYVVGRVRLGRFEHSGLRLIDGPTNILGLGYLARFRVTFDFPNNILYLQPGERYAAPEEDDENIAGVHVTKADGQVLVDSVDYESPAEAAGIKEGDQIVRVDGKDAATIGFFELRRLFASRDGRKVTLSTIRAGKAREVELILKAPAKPSDSPAKEPSPKTN